MLIVVKLLFKIKIELESFALIHVGEHIGLKKVIRHQFVHVVIENLYQALEIVKYIALESVI